MSFFPSSLFAGSLCIRTFRPRRGMFDACAVPVLGKQRNTLVFVSPGVSLGPLPPGSHVGPPLSDLAMSVNILGIISGGRDHLKLT